MTKKVILLTTKNVQQQGESVKCGRYGHFARFCKGGKSGWEPRGGEGGSGTGKRHFNVPILFSVNDGHIGEDDSFAFTVMEEATCVLSNVEEPVVVVNIWGGGGKLVVMCSLILEQQVLLNEHGRVQWICLQGIKGRIATMQQDLTWL